MRFFNIEKGSVKTVIDELQFEKIYKPQGWKVVSNAETGELINNINAEGKIKNINKMKKVKDEKFNDGLFNEG